MALIKCPECGHDVSNTAKVCPNCGYKIKKSFVRSRNRDIKPLQHKKPIYISIMALILIILFIILSKFKFVRYEIGLIAYKCQNYTISQNILNKLYGYKDAAEIINECYYNLGKKSFENQDYEKSIELFEEVYGKEDIYSYIDRAEYYLANDMIANKKYSDAFELLCTINATNLTSTEDLDEATKACADIKYDDLIVCVDKLINEGKINVVNDMLQKMVSSTSDKDCLTLQMRINRLYNLQGVYYNSKDRNDTIEFNGFSVIVSKGNDFLPDGTYEATIGDCVDQILDKTHIGLKFGNGFYVILSGTEPKSINVYNENEWGYVNYQKNINNTMIKKNDPQIGMSTEEVEASTWGKPYNINKTTYSWGTKEQWCYSNNKYIYFENGIVTAVSE